MTAILRSWGEIYFVDGFAGPGKYVEDGIEGSPLLAAQHAQRLASEEAGYSLKCINVESDSEVFLNLQSSTTCFKNHIKNFHGEFGELVPKILSLVSDKPTLFFLDPIGVKGLEWYSLLPLFQRASTTELLIRFDAQTALRLTGSDTNLHSTFNSILGEENSNYWRDCLSNDREGSQAKRECLTEVYEQKLSLHFPHIGRIPIKSSDDSLKYYLLFATRRLKGMQAMNDVCFKVQDLRNRILDKERQQQNIPHQMAMPKFALTREDPSLYELKILKTAILEALGNGEIIKRDELRGCVASIGDNFGRFSGSQFTAVLGGKPRGVSMPAGFENLKAKIQIHNGLTLGNDKVKISLLN